MLQEELIALSTDSNRFRELFGIRKTTIYNIYVYILPESYHSKRRAINIMKIWQVPMLKFPGTEKETRNLIALDVLCELTYQYG